MAVVESSKQRGKVGSSPRASIRRTSRQQTKKRDAANYLNRMKQGSSSNNGVVLDALKYTPLTSESTAGKGGSEVKTPKKGEKKEQATRTNVETRQAKETGSPGKRNVGKPSKRGAAPPPPALGKRGRVKGEIETPTSKMTKKRSRKL